MEKMEMKDIEGTAYTLIAYSKALRCKVRLVIWQMLNKHKVISILISLVGLLMIIGVKSGGYSINGIGLVRCV